MNVDRYKVLPPAEEDNIEQWKAAIDNAKAQLLHMENRTMNLELLKKFGTTAWKEHLKEVEVLCES